MWEPVSATAADLRMSCCATSMALGPGWISAADGCNGALRQTWPAFGEGSGLPESQNGNPAGLFQVGAAFDQYAELRRASDACHYRRGRGNHQRPDKRLRAT